MMRKIQFVGLLLAVISFAACDQKGTISGNISNAEGQTVVLEYLSSTEVTGLDSVKVDPNGDFNMDVKIAETGFHRLRVDKDNSVILILEPTDKVVLTGNAFDFYSSYEVEGSNQSSELKKLDHYLRTAFEIQDSLTKVFKTFQQQGHPNLDSIGKVLDARYQKMNKEKRQFIVDFINDNEGKLVSLSAVESLSPEDDIDLFIRVEEGLKKTMDGSEYLVGYQKRLEAIKAKAQAGKATEIGAMAPEISITDPNGNPIKLSDFRGKYVLIDFWAAWCKPCRMENPHVKKVYETYKDKNFEIFGVSLDRSKDKWLAAIEQDQLPWKHGSELKFWQSSFVPVYGIEGIPMTVLVDPDGKIIAKGLRAAKLDEKLKEVIG